jgi:hypothetical protein
MRSAFGAAVMDILLSDSAILFLAFAGLLTTTVSIVRDTRSQRARLIPEQLPVLVQRRGSSKRRKLAA